VLSEDGNGYLLELGDRPDDQQVLAAAQAVGRVRHFGLV